MGVGMVEGHRGHVCPSLPRTEPLHRGLTSLTKSNNSIQRAVLYKIGEEKLCPHIAPS